MPSVGMTGARDSKPLVLGKITMNDGFAHSVAAYVQRQAKAWRSIENPNANKRRAAAACDSFAGYLGGVAQDNQSLRAIQVVQSECGLGLREYRPGKTQARLIGQLGLDSDSPTSEDLLEELAAAAVEDLAENAKQRVGDAYAVAERREADAARKMASADQHIKEQIKGFRAERRVAVAETARLRRENEHLRASLSDDGDTEKKVKVSA